MTYLGSIVMLMFCYISTDVEYKNETHKFTMKYPDSWTKQEENAVISFVSPSNDDSSKVNIVIEDLQNPMKQEDYFKMVEQQVSQLAGVKVTGTTVKFADREAMLYEYTYKSEGISFKMKQYWFMNGKTAYVLAYTAPETKFNSNKDVATKMIETFTFY